MAKRPNNVLLALGIILLLGGAMGVIYDQVKNSSVEGMLTAAPSEKARRQPMALGAPVQVVTLAGHGHSAQQDGPAKQAGFADPYGIALDARGNLYVADAGDNNRIRKISPEGVVTTLAGGSEGYANGEGASAKFHTPSALVVDSAGNILVADSGNHAIRKITPEGQVTTLAGNGMAGFRDGPAAQAQFNGPLGLALDNAGNVYVADTYNDRIRVIRRDGQVETLAGGAQTGYQDGIGASAMFDTPSAVLVNPLGEVVVADTVNHAIRLINQQGMVSTLARSLPQERQALLRRPQGLALSEDGVLYVSDTINGRVIQITAKGEVRGLHGIEIDIRAGDEETPRLNGPTALAFNAQGELVVADADALQIRKLVVKTASKDIAREASLPASPAALPVARPALPRATPWPLAPQHRAHEVVGTIGEVRGNYDGENRHHFHGGLDMQAPLGAPVLVAIAEKTRRAIPNWGYEELGEGMRLDSLSYVHIKVGRKADNSLLDPTRFQQITPIYENTPGKTRMRVKRGTRFNVGEQIGSVNRMYHVHLEYSQAGQLENPLKLGFVGLQDNIAPSIEKIELLDPQGKALSQVRGKRLFVPRSLGQLGLVVYAYDQMDGNGKSRRLGLYRLGYQILRADGSAVPGFEQALIQQQYDRLPQDDEMVKLMYSENSGITVYGNKRTIFGYQLSNTLRNGVAKTGALHIDKLPKGDYLIRITAQDFAGNQALAGRDLALTVGDL